MPDPKWNKLWSTDPETRLPRECSPVWLGWPPCAEHENGHVEWVGCFDHDDVKDGGLYQTATHWAEADKPEPPSETDRKPPSHAGVIDPEDIADPLGEKSAFDPAESPVVRPEGWCGHPSCDLPNCEGKHWTRAFNLADRVVETIRREHAAYVSDIKTRFDPETQRLETTLSVRLHDAEEERRLTDVSTPSAARVVEECLEQYMRDAGGARSISENESSDPNRCYVCTETRPLDDRQVVTLHTNTGDRTCIVCERCRDLVDWEPLDHLVAMPDQARCSVRDREAAQRAVDGEERDDDEGLPALSDGSRWDGEGSIDSTTTKTRVWIAECPQGEPGVWFSTETEDKEHGAWLADVLHVIARHQRQRGCYLPDHIRALAGELLTEANAAESGWKELLQQFPPCLPSFEQHERVRGKRDAAHRILAILDRLHAEGIC